MQLTDSFVLLVLVLLLPPREEARLAAAHLAAVNEQAEQGAHLCPKLGDDERGPCGAVRTCWIPAQPEMRLNDDIFVQLDE